MAKKPPLEKPPETAETPEQPPVTVTYDLFDLPTAQHKAGLAGLLLQIESMRQRKKTPPSYEWSKDAPTTKVNVTFNEETTKCLFDDLYDAAWVEGPPREKPFFRGKGETKKEVPAVRRAPFTKKNKNGEEKIVDGYVYLELTPALATLRHYLPEKGEWVKLWRDLLWQIVREGQKKAPYIQRAAAKAPPAGATVDESNEAESEEEEDEKGTGDGSSWVDLLKHEKARRKNDFAVGILSGALLLGAMAKNAEIIQLKGRVDQNLLLHFWPLTVMVYVPRFIDRDGNTHIGRRDKDDKSQHFCIAVPEVCDLKWFLEDYPRSLMGLSPELAVYRPREALIDIAAEGGISFIEHLARLVPQVAGSTEARHCVTGVDYFHVNKDGNNVKFLTTGRVAYSPDLAEDYLKIAGRPGEKPPFGNPLFRRALMQALLENVAWFQPFGKLFQEWPAEFFISSEKSPQKLSWFWSDARKRLQEVMQRMPTEPNDPSPSEDDFLAATIHRFIRHYLDQRLKADAGYDFAAFRKAKATPPEASAARQKLGERLFLEFRSRRDQAFIDHFSGTFFRVAQYMGRDFERIASALMNRTDTVKTLTLMALSANSWVPAQKKESAK